MLLRTTPSRTRWLPVLALSGALVLSGCSDDGADEPADQPTQQTEGQDEQTTTEDGAATETEDEAAAEDDAATEAEGEGEGTVAEGDCRVDAATVTEIVDVGLDISLDDVNELADGGVSCIYEAENDDVAVIVAVSIASWDGSDERVDGVVEQTTEYYGEPVATPDLGDQAFVFDEDFAGVSLVVFEGENQYSTGISGAGWGGTPLEDPAQRQQMATELFEAATG